MSRQIDSQDCYVRRGCRYLQCPRQNPEDLCWTRVEIALFLTADLWMLFQKPASLQNLFAEEASKMANYPQRTKNILHCKVVWLYAHNRSAHARLV